MSEDLLTFSEPVTLVGGGEMSRESLAAARAIAPRLVAADGAADRLLAWGEMPDAVVGDMDSISDRAHWEESPAAVRHLPEQDTTDFEKCLYVTEAPFYLAVGFTGRRLDHTLAVLHAMLVRAEKRVVLVGEVDASALAPPGRVLELTVAAGARVSLFPLLPVRGIASEGLRWSVAGLEMAPGVQSGTSNIASDARVRLGFDGPGAVVILEQRHLSTLVDAVVRG